MAYSPQDVYARHLVSRRGYPLWTPEPSMSLPDIYVREGLKIGDVGVVVPEDGSFDVFFNVCLSPDHSLHRETGVPNNFSPIPLGVRDIAKFPKAESAGRIISTSSMARVRNTDGSDEDIERRTQPGPLNYEFTLSSREGAVLILPEGAERYYLRNERLFKDEAIRHAVDWYTFAEQRLGRIISHDSLYLITGFYKACSWSLAAYQQGVGAGEASAQFKAAQVGRGDIATSYTWETSHAMDWRVGPSSEYYYGIANQTVFIQGFKIAVREGILGTKRINVKADFPSVRSYRVDFSSSLRVSNLRSGGSRSTSGPTANPLAPKGTNTCSSMDTSKSNLPADESDAACQEVTIQCFPQVAKPFHPSDIINQYLLREMPSANVAVTHDNQWIVPLEKGLLDPEELSQDNRLIDVVSRYDIVGTNGAVYLDSSNAWFEDDDYDESISTSSEDFAPLSPGHDIPSPQLSDSGLPESADLSAGPYTCGYESIPSANPREPCQAAYHIASELQEHVKRVHLGIVGPVFRCGLPRCGRSCERIGELEYHVQFSGAHSRDPIPPDSARPFLEAREVLSKHSVAKPLALNGPLATLPFNPSRYQSRGSRDARIKDKKVIKPTSEKLQPVRSLLDMKQLSNLPPTPGNFPRPPPLEEPGPARVSCNTCRAEGILCDSARPPCVRCSRLSVACVYSQNTEMGDKSGPTLIPFPRKKSLFPARAESSTHQGHTPDTPESSRSTLKPLTRYCDACRACRTRCDGIRPKCTICMRRSTPCVYSFDTKGKVLQPTSSPSSLDQSSATSNTSKHSWKGKGRQA